MEHLWIVFALLLTLFVIALPFLSWFRILTLDRKVRELTDRVSRLEYLRTAERPAATTAATWIPEPAEPAAAAPLAAPIAPVPAIAPSAPAIAPSPPEARAPLPPVPAPPRPAPEPAFRDSHALEEKIGGVWMQNVGAVVLLLGIFLFILWGYTTGRIGPGILVVTGVAIGLFAVWRGDRLARSLPRLGHAFIGAGFGAVYLSLYLGHYTLHVLPPLAALVLLTLTSVATFAAGLRYRVQAIAAFGVLGAFIPQLFAAWFGMRGFTLTPLALLGYLAVVDVLVWALAARAGWSGLDLAALFLSVVTWLAANPVPEPTLTPIIGLGVLFTGLGLAPLPALVKVEGEVKPVDLAVIAAAPAALMLTAWPWLAAAERPQAALYLFAFMIPQLVAAWWVDTRRPERDLWRPLTGAATVFLTLGLQRLVDQPWVGLTWGVEGTVLVLLGARPRSGWLRACGHVVTVLAVGLAVLEPSIWGQLETSTLWSAASVRNALLIAALVVGAWGLGRYRDGLASLERHAPEAWTLAANFLLALWWVPRMDELTGVLHRAFAHDPLRIEGGAWHTWPGLFVASLGMAWSAQAAALAWRGARAGGGFLRGCAYALAAVAVVVTLASFAMGDHWRPGNWPVLYPEGLVVLATMALLLVAAGLLAGHRTELAAFDRRAPEAFAVGLLGISLLWTWQEASHLAVLTSHAPIESPATHTLGAALTSAAWLLEASLLLAIGWMRTTTLLRWAGLVILGLTLAKFLFYDMSEADVFWRFLTAIAAGAAMLAVSYFYQRRVKERRARG